MTGSDMEDLKARLEFRNPNPMLGTAVLVNPDGPAAAAALTAQAEEIERLTKERDALKAGVPRLREALKKCADAADEFYRYQYGGEARGSYDGKPERRGIFDAGRQARAVLQSGGDGK